MKLYALYTPSHEIFKDRWFLPTLREAYELVLEKCEPYCPSGSFMSEGWMKVMSRRIDLILRAVDENPDRVFVVSDVDIQFFGPTRPAIERFMRGLDFAAQKDASDRLKARMPEMSGHLCAGFFACRGNEKTRRLWQDVRRYCEENPGRHDQHALNALLNGFKARKRRNRYGIRWDYLPPSFFGPGPYLGKGDWHPGREFELPEKILLHHANWTKGIENKLRQLEHVRAKVGRRRELSRGSRLRKIRGLLRHAWRRCFAGAGPEKKYTVILPYYCEEEIQRYLKIADYLKRHTQRHPGYEFLLASSPWTDPCPRLYDAFSLLGPVRYFRCRTPAFGHTDGPAAMFWDCMQFLCDHGPRNGGFALWFESDMIPVRGDWMERLAREWESEPGLLLMGHFVASFKTRDGGMAREHINGGACYAKDFARYVPCEGRRPAFDVQFFPSIRATGRWRDSALFGFANQKNFARQIRAGKRAILHGFRQDKDLFIRNCIREVVTGGAIRETEAV